MEWRVRVKTFAAAEARETIEAWNPQQGALSPMLNTARDCAKSRVSQHLRAERLDVQQVPPPLTELGESRRAELHQRVCAVLAPDDELGTFATERRTRGARPACRRRASTVRVRCWFDEKRLVRASETTISSPRSDCPKRSLPNSVSALRQSPAVHSRGSGGSASCRARCRKPRAMYPVGHMSQKTHGNSDSSRWSPGPSRGKPSR